MDNVYYVGVYERASIDIRSRDSESVNESLTFHVEQGAHLYVTIVQNVAQPDGFMRVVINAAHSAVVSLIVLGCEDEQNRWDIEINCNGEHANVSVAIGYMIRNNQSLQLITKQSHTAIGCISSIMSKGILFDRSSVDFSGLISIGEAGRCAQAKLHNKNIIASDCAVVRARPQLEISAHEVSCTHGAASGSLNEQDLYYMQSRGLDENRARALLVEGFIEEVIKAHPFYDQAAIWQELKNKLTL